MIHCNPLAQEMAQRAEVHACMPQVQSLTVLGVTLSTEQRLDPKYRQMCLLLPPKKNKTGNKTDSTLLETILWTHSHLRSFPSQLHISIFCLFIFLRVMVLHFQVSLIFRIYFLFVLFLI